ncbi:MAG: TonB-dependent receptor [Bryobacteraceae bacterium]
MKQAALWLALCALPCAAQNVTGAISGSVQDSSGQTVPAASVTVSNTATGTAVKLTTDDRGDFTANGLQAGTYRILVSKGGFKQYEQSDIVLTAGERRAVGSLVLQLGAVNETITVAAAGASVQTVSAERSGVITRKQMTDLMLIGRDYLGLLQTLPGVADFSSHESPAGFNFNMAVQGNRPGTNNLAIDGASNLNSGSGTATKLSPSVDAIGEVKILLNNYQAEYGRNSGASINLITRGGTKEFHGSGYYFKRNEALNANNYFFNLRNQRRPRYRYDFGGFNVGGPVYVPGKFNSSKDKLFFFVAQEILPQSFPNAQNLLTMPTALERAGDFSQTLDQNRRLIVIRDPTTSAAFPGNVIPASRINTSGQKLLGVFPLPNFVDPTGSANFITSDLYTQPRYETLFRIDYRIHDNHSIYFRGIADSQDQTAGYGVPAQGGNWSLLPSIYKNPTKGALLSMTNTLTPTLIHEVSFMLTRSVENVVPKSQADVDKVSRDKLGITLPQRKPGINPLNLVPQSSFGGVPNAAAIAFESRYPFGGVDNTWEFTESVTKVQGAHNLKGGIYLDRTQRFAKRASVFNGSFDFGRDPNNPLDTNWAYSNAMLGVYRTYSESDNRPVGNMRFWNIEWYGQDTWKVTRKLTLDYGMRFSIVQPQYDKFGHASSFDPAFYDFKKAAVLAQPVRDSAGVRVGLNPLTGQLLGAPLIGSIVGGDPLNGVVAADANPNYPRALYENRGVQWGPRFGLAYDPFGDGKTAVRGGFGISYNRDDSSIVLPFTENPPFVFTPTSFNGYASDLLTAGAARFPGNMNAIARSGEVPTVMSFSLGVQRDIGFGTLLDVAYAGNLGRHLRQSVNLNGLRPGANFLAQNQDPTNPGRPLTPDFLRPYPGFGNINYVTYNANSNYNSLQVQVHRRFQRGLQVSGVWTWSKTMSTGDGGAVSPYLDFRSRNYERAGFDRTHIVNINWIYDLPSISKFWANAVTRQVFDKWQLSGIASFVSGAPQAVGLTTTDGADISGSPNEAVRPDVVGKADLAKSAQTFLRYFNTAAFARPARGTLGNAARFNLRGPGINNWDIGLYKNIAITERYRFQFRWETYNTFNHAQFDSMDLTARFDPAGNQVNARFGQLLSARNPRRMQLALKFIF